MNTVFLDLDGTLTDPAKGIFRSFNHALRHVGWPELNPEEMGWIIGPPLIESFSSLGVPNPQEAVDRYRDAYVDGGLFECMLYPGIPDVLAALRRPGFRIILMTAKPHVFARKITAHFNIARYFDAEYGPELDGTRNDKSELLAHALDQLHADPARSVMVGDRLNDFRAASRNDMASVGVGWGYGDDLELAQATVRCNLVADLPDAIRKTSLLTG